MIKEFTQDQFAEIKPYWKELETGKEMSVFQLYDWNEKLNQHWYVEKKKKPFRKYRYVVCFKNDKPVMIAPICIFPAGIQYKKVGCRRGFYFIGRHFWSDYLNFIYKEFSPEALEEIMSYLTKKYKIKHFCFELIPEDTSSYKYLDSKYETKKNLTAAVVLKMPNSFEDYRLLLSKSTRQNIRTAINRQNKNDIHFSYEMVYDFDEALIDNLYNIREMRLGAKKKDAIKASNLIRKLYFILSPTITRITDVPFHIIEEGINRWAFVVRDTADNTIAGYYWGLYNPHTRTYLVILAGVNEKYQWYSPTTSMFYKYLEENYANNSLPFDVMDYSRGDEKYKFDLGGTQRYCIALSFDRK